MPRASRDRKSTRLNSSHLGISYAVFCLKKKKQTERKLTAYKNNNLAVCYAGSISDRCVPAIHAYSKTTFFLAQAFFFFNDTATTGIYTLSLHDALPISTTRARAWATVFPPSSPYAAASTVAGGDRKSTRLNSSHLGISYAVFCLKKKKKKNNKFQVKKKKKKKKK